MSRSYRSLQIGTSNGRALGSFLTFNAPPKRNVGPAFTQWMSCGATRTALSGSPLLNSNSRCAHLRTPIRADIEVKPVPKRCCDPHTSSRPFHPISGHLCARASNVYRQCEGGKIPRPFGPSVHGTKLKDLLQLAFVEIGPCTNGGKYVLMLRNSHSDYKWFFPYP